MKKEWDKLPPPEQKIYIEKAEYLLERGYILDRSVEVLAKQIFDRDSG